MEFIAKSEMIDKIYDINGKEWQSVNEVYRYDDSKYRLLLINTQNRWRISVCHNETHSLITEIYYDLEMVIDKLKITKKDAKTIADFVFLAWNTRERKAK